MRDVNVGLSAGFFDVDGTLLRRQLSIELHDEMIASQLVIMPSDMRRKIDEALNAYKYRRGRYDEYIRLVTDAYYYRDLWKGMDVSMLRLIARRIAKAKSAEMYEFTRELSLAAQATGRHRAIISGSPHEAIEALAEEYGIRIFLGSKMEHDGSVYTGKVESHWVHCKDQAVQLLADRHGFALEQSFGIGDTSSDVGIFEKVGYPIAFNPNAELLQVAKERSWPVVIENRNVILLLRWRDGRVEAPTLSEILPPDLATEVQRRLPSLR
jgi:HAD superfamily phosphoserine phosphatase-like hydrolase